MEKIKVLNDATLDAIDRAVVARKCKPQRGRVYENIPKTAFTDSRGREYIVNERGEIRRLDRAR